MAAAAFCGLVCRRAWAFRGAGIRRRPERLVARLGLESSAGFLDPSTHKLGLLHIDIYSSDSALDHILALPKGENKVLVGQHPPSVNAFEDDRDSVLDHEPDQPEAPKILKVAIIGDPNAGKSTLSNQLLGRKILPVSKKVHTTRRSAQGVITKEDTQLVILDTPGLTTLVKARRHHLEKSLVFDPLKSLKVADLVLVLVDVSDHYTRNRLSPQVLRALSKVPKIPSVLVLNKVDLLKKKDILLDLVADLTVGVVDGKPLQIWSKVPTRSTPTEGDVASESGNGDDGSQRDTETGIAKEDGSLDPPKKKKKAPKGWPHFKEIFMLAAVDGEDVETLKSYLLTQAKPGPWKFHSEVLTDQSPREICRNIIREKLLEYLPEEVPYNVHQRTEVWEEGPGGELVILQNLEVQKERHVKMLIGPRGHLISQIAQEAGQDLMNAFLCDVRLKLCVHLKE
ncbi:GTPase Era, mitochondrial [Anolis carolinensis]|uniref:GTPase Era, mitochondrial n=1 Tax=Anolis carolinensis TaxID=28377 RepID=UPI002F2B1DB9